MINTDNSLNVCCNASPFRKHILSSALTNYDLSNNKLFSDAVLKELCSDKLTTETKVHLLLLLEEQVSSWLSIDETIESIVGSLQSQYKQLCQSGEHLLCRQILITSTVILLSAPNTATDAQLCDLLYKHVDYLLQIVTSSSSKSSPLLKMAACQCLQEIEASFPEISFSASSVESLWTACSQETTVAFQSYTSLLALILRNTSRNTRESASHTKLGLSPNSPEGEIDRTPVAMYLMDLLPMLAPATLHTVLSCLIAIPEGQLKTFAMNLQIWVPCLFQSNYLPLLHFALCASKARFADDSVGAESLLKAANHPATPIAHRLLILDWMETALKAKVWNPDGLPRVQYWTPNAFDGAESQGKKMRLLGYVLPKEKLQGVLLQYLEPLQKSGGRSTVVLYRALRHFYSQLRIMELENHILRVTVEMLRVSFGTIIHLLDFVSALKCSVMNSHLPEMILDRSTSWMTELQDHETLHHLDSYLYALHKMALDPDSPPARIKCQLQYLHGLLSRSGIHGNWLQGHQILDTTASLLHRQDIMLLYSDLAEVLFLLLSSRAGDVDVRSRAKICYAALTSITPQNLLHLFPTEVLKGSLPLSQFLSENSSSFPSASPVQQLPSQVLQIKRCKMECIQNQPVILMPVEIGQVFDVDLYYQQLDSVAVPLRFELQLCEDRDAEFQVVYGVHLQIQYTDQNNYPIQSVNIPALTEKHVNEGFSISLSAKPLQAQPLLLTFKAELTTSRYLSYRGELNQQHIPLGDLFLPLPVAPSLRAPLFDLLWQKIINSHCGMESACCLKASRGEMCGAWKQFLLTKDPADERVALFFVPSTHILIRLKTLEERCTQVLFITDNSDILPWFIDYLQGLVT